MTAPDVNRSDTASPCALRQELLETQAEMDFAAQQIEEMPAVVANALRSRAARIRRLLGVENPA